MRKSVLITGVSGGIGNAVAFKFAENGFDIIATYNSHQISDALRQFCQNKGICLTEVQLDICNSQQVEKVFCDAFKGAKYLDCVVCNSGVSLGEKMLCDNVDDEIQQLIKTNLLGTIYCNREASKHMLKQKHGNIINISSIYGINGGSCESVYSASKAGIIGLTKALAKEMSFTSVRVNAVAPGFVETNMTAKFSEEEKEAIRQSGEMGISRPEDVADVVYRLAVEDVHSNGEVVLVD